MIRSILVPLDFSDFAPVLAGRAAQLARQLNASLTLMHVYELPSGMHASTVMQPKGQRQEMTVQQWVEDDFNARLPALEAQLLALETTAAHRLEFGHPAQAICQVAQKERFDLIVMGTHGRTGILRALSGSVAEEVIRHCEVPVMTIRMPLHPTQASTGEQSSGELQLDAESTG